MKRVLQAGHWKSLKTSITIGAFFEPAETWGSTSGTAAVDWAALMASAGASRSAKKPVKLKASELAFRKRPTRSSLTFLYITRTSKNTTCDSRRIEAWSQTMCRMAASGLLLGCVPQRGRWLSAAASERAPSHLVGKRRRLRRRPRNSFKLLQQMALAASSTNLTRIHSTCILRLELTVG
jgi:hypothetical protein